MRTLGRRGGPSAGSVVPPALTKWLTASPAQATRNDATAWVGCHLTVGAIPITVYRLGRWVYAGNTHTHTLYLWDSVSNRQLGSVTVSTLSGTPGSYVYGELTPPVTLVPGQVCYLVSSEVATLDAWGDGGAGGLTTTTAATMDGTQSSPNMGATWAGPTLGTGHSYGPLDMQYH